MTVTAPAFLLFTKLMVAFSGAPTWVLDRRSCKPEAAMRGLGGAQPTVVRMTEMAATVFAIDTLFALFEKRDDFE